MYTLVVCEKPDAARKIAQALGEPTESKQGGISIFNVKSGRYNYKICTAFGHLYGLTDVSSNRSIYPALDLEWAPITDNPRVVRAIKVISELSKYASSFIHACDYDQEGEVIGYNILQYACGSKYTEALRAKFSTLTEEEIRVSFANLYKTQVGLAEAGRSRHMLDFIYGVNLSRALVRSFKTTGRYYNLSIGRVQGPTLSFVVKREIEIRSHIPNPYWTITVQFDKDEQIFSAVYENPKVERFDEAKSIVNACTGRNATVNNVSENKSVLRSPLPFNIGDLQREAHKLFKLSPSYTLAIAEKLYLRALISYPRTSSQKLPASIGYYKIISRLSRISKYSQLASILLSKDRLVPNEGQSIDQAHPAIYPTGIPPRQKLNNLEFKVYDLIVKRFLAAFGDPAVSIHINVTIDVNGCVFKTEGIKPTYEGWAIFYKPYVRFNEHKIPELHIGDLLRNLGVKIEEKVTQPPYRYNQASLLAKMEQEKIGTKATRADIMSTLLKRNYMATGRSGLEVSDIGIAVIDSMGEFMPDIVSTDLTRLMDEQLENVEQGSVNSVSVIEQAVDRLVESLTLLMKNEADVGAQINSAASAYKAQISVFGPCPLCKKGQFCIVRSRATKKRFIGCSNYADGCKATAPLPQKGSIITTGKMCHECSWPVVGVVFVGRTKQLRTCINTQCPRRRGTL